VRYRLEVRGDGAGQAQELMELHRMRYLFQPEVEFLLE